jgi:hypothetical protein
MQNADAPEESEFPSGFWDSMAMVTRTGFSEEA